MYCPYLHSYAYLKYSKIDNYWMSMESYGDTISKCHIMMNKRTPVPGYRLLSSLNAMLKPVTPCKSLHTQVCNRVGWKIETFSIGILTKLKNEKWNVFIFVNYNRNFMSIKHFWHFLFPSPPFCQRDDLENLSPKKSGSKTVYIFSNPGTIRDHTGPYATICLFRHSCHSWVKVVWDTLISQ